MATDNYNQGDKNKGPFYLVVALLVVAALGLTAVYVAGSDNTDDLTSIEAASGPAVDNDLDGIPDDQEVGDLNEATGIEEDDTLVEIDNPQNESGTSAEEVYEDSVDAVQETYEDAADAVEETADDVDEQLEEDAEAANDPNRPTASDDMQQ